MVDGTQKSDLETKKPSRNSGSGKKVVLLGIWLALLVGLIFWIKTAGSGPLPGNPPPPPPAPVLDPAVLEAQWPGIIAHAAAPPRGNAAAPYTIAEFGDFQCPQCGKAYPVLETLLKKYPAQVNLVFLHRPIPSLHKWALSAGQASEVAAAQGKFWPMYDVLYTHQDNLEPGYYGDYAVQIGLNKTQFKTAFASGQGQPQIKADSAFADSLGVQETPMMLVRDNAKKTVAIYCGTKGTQYPDGSLQYPGLQTLAARPPWAK